MNIYFSVTITIIVTIIVQVIMTCFSLMIDIEAYYKYTLATNFIIYLSNPNIYKKSPCFLPLYTDNQYIKIINIIQAAI